MTGYCDGSRSFHHKSRNGCSRCKQRRVKCSKQAPTCSNCRRRNEKCTYEDWTAVSQAMAPHIPMSLTQFEANFASCLSMPVSTKTDSSSSKYLLPSPLDIIITSCIPESLQDSVIPVAEMRLWTQALAPDTFPGSYLGPSLKSLQILYKQSRQQTSSQDSQLAYYLQLVASQRFRTLPSNASSTSWCAMLIFSFSTIMFQFASQQICPIRDFDYLQTLALLRISVDLALVTMPYLMKSDMWPAIQLRIEKWARVLDPSVENALTELEDTILAATMDNRASTAHLRACRALKNWAKDCGGFPWTWKDYIQWPAQIPEAFINLIAQEDDIALLILIYWCAVLHLGPRRWFIERWPSRAAACASSKLKENWIKLLVWPTAVFDTAT